MAPQVLHQSRVAWDFARTVTAVATMTSLDVYAWFSARINDLLGARYCADLNATRISLALAQRPDVRQAEAGLWRARIEDVLRNRPDLGEDLTILRLDATARLARANPGIPG